MFLGHKISSDDTQTLASYYNLSAFNNTLSSGHFSELGNISRVFAETSWTYRDKI